MSLLGKRKRKPERHVSRSQLQASSSDDEPESVQPCTRATKRGSLREQDSEEDSSSDQKEDLRSVFAHAFNARFAPLPDAATAPARSSKSTSRHKSAATQDAEMEDMRESEDSDDADDNLDLDEQDSGSEFSSFSSSADETTPVTIVEHTLPNPPHDPFTASREKRAFMSTKPPTTLTPNPAPSTADADSDNETTNLKNDLALTRLLAESHLLSPSSAAANLRHKLTDLRLHALGAKSSILTNTNMPATHLRGMRDKAARREAERRREAKENGIVLERPREATYGGIGKKKSKVEKRERGIRGSVGRFRGGTLVLSKRDVEGITGRREGDRGRGRGRGRGGRGGSGGRGKMRALKGIKGF